MTDLRAGDCIAGAGVDDHRQLPPPLAHASPPVHRLFLAGDPGLLERGVRIGIVGSRRPRADATEAARRIAWEAARAGCTIVSGLAIGIDATAHRAALDAGGATVAVLAGGLRRVQPMRNRDLAREIAGGRTRHGVEPGCRAAPGLVVSEYGEGEEESFPWRFKERNRVIAALADYLVLIQATHGSGSMSTAEHALQLGVQVGVLPSAPDDPCHSGTMSLIRDGADAVVDGASLFRRLELHGVARPGFAAAAARGGRLDADRSGRWTGGAESQQLELVQHPLLVHLAVPRTADELADLAGTPLSETRMQLLELEELGLVLHADDGSWLRPRGGS